MDIAVDVDLHAILTHCLGSMGQPFTWVMYRVIFSQLVPSAYATEYRKNFFLVRLFLKWQAVKKK